MPPYRPNEVARPAYWAVLALGWLLCLKLNLPGHLTTDTVTAIYEGRFHLKLGWGPPAYAWLMGLIDGAAPRGTAMALQSLLLFAAWGALALVRMASWWAVALAAALVLIPDVLVYQGVVWRDVLFADLAAAAFVLIALAAVRRRAAGAWLFLAPAALCLAFAALVRQNGGAYWPLAVIAVAVALRASGPTPWWRALAGAGLWAGLLLALAASLSQLARPQGAGASETGVSIGMRILQHYDLAGAAAREPGRPMAHIRLANPQMEAKLRSESARLYSPARVDTLDGYLGNFWSLPDATVRADWLDIIREDPVLYARERLAVFRWVLATPSIEACLPVALGVEGPPEMMARLGLVPNSGAQHPGLYGYVRRFMHTPAYSHVTYLLLALAGLVLLLRRRAPADLVMAAMLLGALAFTASFFLLSIACDYRYLYALDVSAMTAWLYLALGGFGRRGETGSR